ncbi:DJ-1 family glyoxalase III [Clostridium sp. BJN0001]|uniref:DJ-1 family glyoxalase III n=1 Tax=Clostridium sp. BJN0001 TaxID=2930219 RepID=UPI001FD2777D|nr:DJ-1 family glyoxalase III [Clostridium sp. BJN0001]
MKKVCVLLAEGFEEVEALTVSDVMRRAGISCDLVSISDKKETVSAHNVKIIADKIFDENNMDYDLIVLPGGLPGATNLADDKRVIKLLKKQNEENKFIGAICAAPLILGRADLTEGKIMTSYPGFSKYMKGCTYVEDKKVCVDKNIITSRGPATALPFAYKLLEVLGYEKESEEISKGMLYRS